jgi:hypothetical protein
MWVPWGFIQTKLLVAWLLKKNPSLKFQYAESPVCLWIWVYENWSIWGKWPCWLIQNSVKQWSVKLTNAKLHVTILISSQFGWDYLSASHCMYWSTISFSAQSLPIIQPALSMCSTSSVFPENSKPAGATLQHKNCYCLKLVCYSLLKWTHYL